MSGKARAAPASPLDDPAHLAAVEKFRAHDVEKQAAAGSAIAMLERRVKTATADIPLGNGDVVKVRTRLSKTEAQRVKGLIGTIQAIEKKLKRATVNDAGETVVEIVREATPAEQTAVEEASDRFFSLILYDPVRTPDEIYAWLAANPGAFSEPDQETIFLTYRWIAEDEAQQRENLKKFRPQCLGP